MPACKIFPFMDIVDRRSEFLPDVVKDFIQTDADVFWAQLSLEMKKQNKSYEQRVVKRLS